MRLIAGTTFHTALIVPFFAGSHIGCGPPGVCMNAAALSDVELARFNMVEQQIRPAGVLDQAVLQSLFEVRREQYVSPALRGLAFSDAEIPLRVAGTDTGEVMLPPKTEAMLVQELNLKNTESVLEIGTGSGHQAALLAWHAYQVTSVEINPRLAEFATENLARQGVANAHVEVCDAHNGWGSNEYDA